MKVDYKKTVDLLLNEAGISSNEIYDFTDTPGEEEFRNNLDFCQEALERHKNYGIVPSTFYYRDNNSIDARAKKKNGHYLVGLNKGLLEFFDRCFITVFTLSDIDEANKYVEIENKIPDSIGVLMYQVTIHFTFYHELGHLIQFVEREEIENDESLAEETNFSLVTHSEELDADIFSSICVSTHIYQYFEKHANFKSYNKVECSSFLYITPKSHFLI
ncbi:MAG: hypothetical protein JXR48_14470 [Candidatus Delongbacteria bacterium]|nr:hypothetical protein [Candidatus Delongbacteria bacterium]